MDANGKPRMSRQLLQRLMKCDQTAPVKATRLSARPQSFDQRRRQEVNAHRQHVTSYRRSNLANQSYIRRPGGEISLGPRHESGSATGTGSPPDTPLGNRRPAGASAASGVRLQTGANRPSAGFQEPPGRGYNPFA